MCISLSLSIHLELVLEYSGATVPEPLIESQKLVDKMSSSSSYFTDSGASTPLSPVESRTSEALSVDIPPVNNPAQILLQALQNYILPLINTSSSQTTNGSTCQTPWGPEAVKFLGALQDFIASIVRSQSNSGSKNIIEVDLNDDEDEATDASSDLATSISSLDTIPSPVAPKNDKDDPFNIFTEESAEISNGPQLEQTLQITPLDKILAALRERVFNKMPVRLLNIVPKGFKFQIRLLERSEVYTHLAAQIEAEYSDLEFHSKMEKKRVTTWGLDAAGTEYSVIEEWVSQYAKYAILSHTWVRTAGGEATHGDWHKGPFDPQQPKCHKLINFCKAAWMNHGLTLAWMDTICINKDSSSELDESIRSMYKWYKSAAICITYLAGTLELADMHLDPWFTRGWTFQELLGPDDTHFYNTDWKKLIKSPDNNKYNHHILKQIRQATTITESELRRPQDMSISRKMQLAAKREVSREEDIAYSLMGVCNVSISIAYGEGAKRAFYRLMTEVLNSSSHVMDVFNCAQDPYSIIPSTPLAYLQRSMRVVGLNWEKPLEPLILTHVGLRIPVLLMPSLLENDPEFKDDPIGEFYAKAELPAQDHKRAIRLLDKGVGISPVLGGSSWTLNLEAIHSIYTTIGVLNFGGDNIQIEVPKTCLAVAFPSGWTAEWESTSTSIGRLRTQEPIVFELMKKKIPDQINYGYSIKRSELAKHGMKLVTMYL